MTLNDIKALFVTAVGANPKNAALAVVDMVHSTRFLAIMIKDKVPDIKAIVVPTPVADITIEDIQKVAPQIAEWLAV